jgi:ribonuclease R
LGNMHELAMILRGRRMEHGAPELTMPEVKIDLDKRGRVHGAHVSENTASHQIIEEFMLAANEAVADTLHEKEMAFLRRIHQAPTPRKLKALTEFVTELGFKVGSLEDRFELQTLLKKVEGLPQQHAVNFAVLRSMQRAVYGPEQEGHYALASKCYCHFTSPIRRYPDLTIHRLIEALLCKRKPRLKVDDLIVLGQHCSERERRAESAERELIKFKLLHYLEERIGEEMDAVITGVQSFGLFVQGVELPAEGLVHTESLTDDYYHFDRTTHTLSGHRSGNIFRLGDVLRVVVARVDLDRRELDFRLAARKHTKAKPKTRRRKR